MTEYPTIKVKLSQIKVGERLRKDLGDIDALAESIKEEGLIHPPTIDHNYRLVAGGRRMAAIQKLGWESVPVYFLEVLDDSHLRRLEVEENVRRKQMNWQEKCLGVHAVHVANLETNFKWTVRLTGEMLGVTGAHISANAQVARALKKQPKDEEVWQCDSFAEALKLLLRRKEEQITAELASRGRTTTKKQKKPSKVLGEVDLDDLSKGAGVTPADVGIDGMFGVVDPAAAVDSTALPEQEAEEDVQTIDLNEFLFCGDALDHMQSMQDEMVHSVISDLPYGIDMGNLAQSNNKMRIETTAAEHDVEENLAFIKLAIPEFYRILKSNGFAVLWMDQTHFDKIVTWATAAGFKVQRWALIWAKTHPCKNQAAQYNFTKNYETAYVLRKGDAMLQEPQTKSVWLGSFEDEDKVCQHPFAKPIKLWQWLMRAVLRPGDTYYDPCAGCGSSVLAGITAGFHPIACELKPEHYNQLILNTKTAYTHVLGEKVQFEYEPIH